MTHHFRIAFFVGRFPVLSETFIVRQIRQAIQSGADVTVIAVHRPTSVVSAEGRADEALRVRYVWRSAAGLLSRFLLVWRSVVRRSLAPKAIVPLRAAAEALRAGVFGAALDIAAQAPNGSLGSYDLVVAHFGPIGVRAMYLKRAGLLEGQLATVFHGADMSNRAIVRKYLRGYRALFAERGFFLPVSKLWQERLCTWGAPPAHTRVVRMGVDTGRLQMLPPNRALRDPMRVLAVGRLVEKKGFMYGIRGVARARCSAELTIVGGGPLAGSLQVLASSIGGNRVALVGAKAPERVLELMREADVLLVPSVTGVNGDMEGIPVVLMEAMALGVVVLATRHSGIPELVEDGVTGFLVPERDDQAIADTLQVIARGEPDLSEVRRNARRIIEEQFDASKAFNEMIRFCRG